MNPHDHSRHPASPPPRGEHGDRGTEPAGTPEDEGVPRYDDLAPTPPRPGGGERQAEIQDAAREALRESAGAPAGHGTPEAHAGHDMSGGHAAADAHAGHDTHAGHSPEMFRAKFWGSLALTAGVLAFDEHFLGLVGLRPPAVPFAAYVAPVLGTALYAYGGWPFLQGARRELGARAPGRPTARSPSRSSARGP